MVIIELRGTTSDNLDLNIYYQGHPPEWSLGDFSCRSLFIKKLLYMKNTAVILSGLHLDTV